MAAGQWRAAVRQIGLGLGGAPLRVESDTVEDFEVSGRGLIARKDVPQGENIVRDPRQAHHDQGGGAQRVLGKQVVPDALNEYLALALLLMSERAKGPASSGPRTSIYCPRPRRSARRGPGARTTLTCSPDRRCSTRRNR